MSFADFAEAVDSEVKAAESLAKTKLPDDPVNLEEALRDILVYFNRTLVILSDAEAYLAKTKAQIYPDLTGSIPEREIALAAKVVEEQRFRDRVAASAIGLEKCLSVGQSMLRRMGTEMRATGRLA